VKNNKILYRPRTADCLHTHQR